MAKNNFEWTNAQITKAVLSYPSLFTPDDFGGQRNYKADLLIPKNSEQFKKIFNHICKRVEEDLGCAWKDLNDRFKPIRDFDWESADREDLEGYVIIRTKSKADKKRPVVVDASRVPILDEAEVYGGCVVNANISYGCYKNEFGKGVKIILNGIQKIKDGKPLAGGGAGGDPESMFEVIEEPTSDSKGVESFEL